MAQTERECQILVAPRYSTGKRKRCGAAREIQDVERNVPFQIIVANFFREKKLIFKNQVVSRAGRVPKLMMATTKNTGEMLGIVENRGNESENCQEIPKEIQDSSFPDTDAKHHESIRKMLASFADIWSEKLGCINAVKHLIELTLNIRPFRSAPYRAGPKVRQHKELEVQKQLKAVVIEPSTSKWTSLILFVPKKNGSFRFCIDYRQVNKVAVKKIYPLPRIDECIDSLATAKVFRMWNANRGYWQIPVHEEDLKTRISNAMRVHIDTNACPLV